MDNKHDGHRKRMLDKFLKYGSEIFEDHEMLEMLLFFSIPRANTNDIAHRLIDRFGSLRGVVDASIDELCSVEGMGQRSAMQIKIMSSIFSRSSSTLKDKRKRFKTVNEVVEYLQSLYIGESKEVVYMLMFNNSMRLIATQRIAEGGVNRARLDFDNAIVCAKSYNASHVVMAHNHPGGLAKASVDDLKTTEKMAAIFSNFGIRFIEHFVIAEDKYYAILEENKKKCGISMDGGWSVVMLKSDEEKLDELDGLFFEI